MKELIKSTGIDNFVSGQKLSSDILNSMNSRINELVDTVNMVLKSYININIEENNLTGSYKFLDILKKVPQSRRTCGTKIAYREAPEGHWVEYLYIGLNPMNEKEWLNENNWKQNLKPVIDGGVWINNDYITD